MAVQSCGLRFIELVVHPALPPTRLALSRCHISPRRRAQRGYSAYEIRLLGRTLRTLNCLGYNSFVNVGNADINLNLGYGENGASSSVLGETIAVDNVSRLNGLSIVDCSLDYGEVRDVTATETAEVLSSNGFNRLERSNLDHFSSEKAEVASLDYLTGNDRGIAAAAAPAVQLGSDDLKYYVPEIGHRVLGVVVSGSRTKFDVDIGAAKLGELKVSKLFPLDRFQVKHDKWIFPDEVDARETFSKPPHGRPCMVYDEEVFAYEDPALFLIDIGTVLELIVIGKSLSGNPILSARKAAERIAWGRVKQIKELKQPIQVEVIDCNLYGVIAKVEGLRAFLPLKEFINRPKTLEDYIGRNLWVTINFADEIRHSLVISERKAWTWAELILPEAKELQGQEVREVKRNLQAGSLHNGTVIGILPYGVRVQVNRTNIMGLIHISNIAHGLIQKITDVFEVGEQVKMMVVNSDALNTISFSTADLESESGLMLRDKQRVFQEAERTAHAWWIANRRKKESRDNDAEDFSNQAAPEHIANLNWLDFGKTRVSLF